MIDMNLESWRLRENLSIADLAKMSGLEYETVRTHLHGLRKPRDPLKIIYYQISKGEVTPNDFAFPDLNGDGPRLANIPQKPSASSNKLRKGKK